MISTLQAHLCLNRPNFQINPKQSIEDAQLFFGVSHNREFIDAIKLTYQMGYIPRVYVLGQYGTGKTHMLYHLKHHFAREERELGVLPLVVTLEAEGKTRFRALHRRMLEEVGIERLERAYQDYGFEAGPDREVRFRELFSNDAYQVLQLMHAGPGMRLLAWRWLTGEELTSAELQALGVASSLDETGKLCDVLMAIGELFKRIGQRLLFLIDEGEGLHKVTNADSRSSWHDGFRRLADPMDNQSIGFIIAFYVTLEDQVPEFMFEGDITTRLGAKGILRLEPLEEVEVRSFLTDLLAAFVDRQSGDAVAREHAMTDAVTYPFTVDGFRAFVDEAGRAQEHALPRTILAALRACAEESLRRKVRVFDDSLVLSVVPGEFADPGAI